MRSKIIPSIMWVMEEKKRRREYMNIDTLMQEEHHPNSEGFSGEGDFDILEQKEGEGGLSTSLECR